MKKIIYAILSICLFSNMALADCDFSTIVQLPNGNYEYSKACHIKVGEMKRDLSISQEQVKKLGMAIDLKDLALQKSNERADLWMGTSKLLEARVEKLDEMYSKNKWIYFGFGVLASTAAVYAAGQLSHR